MNASHRSSLHVESMACIPSKHEDRLIPLVFFGIINLIFIGIGSFLIYQSTIAKSGTGVFLGIGIAAFFVGFLFFLCGCALSRPASKSSSSRIDYYWGPNPNLPPHGFTIAAQPTGTGAYVQSHTRPGLFAPPTAPQGYAGYPAGHSTRKKTMQF